MIAFVVEVNECPFHLLELLQLRLESRADVVRLLHAHLGRKDDVDFDEEVVAEMECPDRVDVRHFRVMVQRDPRNFLQEVRPRSVAREKLDLFWNLKHEEYRNHIKAATTLQPSSEHALRIFENDTARFWHPLPIIPMY